MTMDKTKHVSEQGQYSLPEQVFRFKDIMDQVPVEKGLKKKIFFQAELQSLKNGVALFGVIAYPAWGNGNRWELGYKITAAGPVAGEPHDFNTPIGFANNELSLTRNKKKKGKKNKEAKKQEKEFCKLLAKILESPKLAEKAQFRCKTSISENPHLEYDVTLEADGISISARTNPSPPGSPSL